MAAVWGERRVRRASRVQRAAGLSGSVHSRASAEIKMEAGGCRRREGYNAGTRQSCGR